MDVQKAVDNFVGAFEHCQNLVEVHRAAGSGGRGRRNQETSLNRGTIVMAVATWQAFVQDLALALRDAAQTELQTVTGTSLLSGAMTQWTTDLNQTLELFSTPGPAQSLALWKRAGFTPRQQWTWTQRGGRGHGRVLVKPHHVEMVMQHWLRVRHDVAHGHATITAVPVLGAVRDPGVSAATRAAPTIRLTDAIDCMRFFRSIVKVTADAGAQYVGTAPPSWATAPALALGVHVTAL